MRAAAEIYLATPRIEKPGESSIFAHLARQGADGMLVRNAGGLRYCVGARRSVRGRFLAQRGQSALGRAARRAAARCA